MNAMTKGLLTISLMAAAACDGAPTASNEFVSPGDAGPAFATASSSTLTFSNTPNRETKDPQTASGGVGSINFSGSLVAPTPCFTVSASHSERQSDITVTVSAVDNGVTCTQVITYNNYQGAVSGLAAGTYNLTVVHNLDNSRSTAYSGTVTVQ